MLRHKVRAVWAEPRGQGAPVRVWRDWVLVAVVVVGGLGEWIIRSDVTWPLLSLAMVVPVAAAIFWRRTHPLIATVGIFAPIGLISIYSIAVDQYWEGLLVYSLLLVVPYALTRWGSGREIVLGTALILPIVTVAIISDAPSIGDIIGAYLIVLVTLEIGYIVRAQVGARRSAVHQTRLEEREQLARELHDTVAHHVSAIAIQAQAGRTLAATDPQAAVDVLEVIEEQASRTLNEMRYMVGALRETDPTDDGAALVPQPGVSDIERLAQTNGGAMQVDVELTGELGDLRPAVDTALFRLAQESVTNAIRHARNATRVAVSVDGGDQAIRLRIDDDGDGASGFQGRTDPGIGFGLVGMQERVKLLGGTLSAGPKPDRGWLVNAVLPRETSRAGEGDLA